MLGDVSDRPRYQWILSGEEVVTSTPKTKLELFRDLMICFVGEVEKGIHPLEAGWIKIEGPEIDKLAMSGLVEKGEKGIRLPSDISLLNELDDTSDEEMKELVNTCVDLAKAVEVEKLVTQVSDELTKSSRFQAGVVTLGWWRMLQTSEFSVTVDEVLREGFSFDRWYIDAPKSSLELALALANKWWKVDREGVFDPLREFSFAIPEIPQSSGLERVKKVLRWEEVVELLPEEETKAIAFLWCADYLCLSKGLEFPQSLTFIQASAWRSVSEAMKRSIAEIIEQIGMLVDQLPLQSLISWPEIIRFPW